MSTNNIFAESQTANNAAQKKVVEQTVGGYRREPVANRTTLTISISQEDKDKLQMFALKNHADTSKVIRRWIAENIPDDI